MALYNAPLVYYSRHIHTVMHIRRNRIQCASSAHYRYCVNRPYTVLWCLACHYMHIIIIRRSYPVPITHSNYPPPSEHQSGSRQWVWGYYVCVYIQTSSYTVLWTVTVHIGRKYIWICCCHIYYICISNNAGQPNSAHPSGRCTPEGSGIVDTATMLPGPDVQPSSETSFCTSPLPTDTSAPTEHPVSTHEDEVSHKLDHEGADSPRLDQDDFTLSTSNRN